MTVDKMVFRRVIGSFATGVTVITTGSNGNYHGMTASAVCSLSLDPTLLLICVDKSAETLPYLRETGSFVVNVLADGQIGLSNSFASKSSPQAHGLTGVDYHLGKLGVPVLDGVLGHLECRVVESIEGGDHYIFVGEVAEADTVDLGEPLLYWRGAYRALAPMGE